MPGDLSSFGDSSLLEPLGDLFFGDASFSSLLFVEEGVDGFLVILSLVPALDGVPFPSAECFLDLPELLSV